VTRTLVLPFPDDRAARRAVTWAPMKPVAPVTQAVTASRPAASYRPSATAELERLASRSALVVPIHGFQIATI
jgi:hypothetical protein